MTEDKKPGAGPEEAKRIPTAVPGEDTEGHRVPSYKDTDTGPEGTKRMPGFRDTDAGPEGTKRMPGVTGDDDVEGHAR